MRIDRVTLASRDLEAQRRFYGERLGLPVQLAEGTLQVEVGPSLLIFQADASVEPFYHIAFNIATNQVEAALVWAQERLEVLAHQGELVSRSTDWNSDGFYFYDAEGNILELIARHSLPEPGAAEFGPALIQSISEVGVPVADVPGTVERLERELALPLYDCDRVRFNAMGDELGLLIVVAAGRHWFPTGRPALPLPLQVELRTAVAAPVQIETPEYRIFARPL